MSVNGCLQLAVGLSEAFTRSKEESAKAQASASEEKPEPLYELLHQQQTLISRALLSRQQTSFVIRPRRTEKPILRGLQSRAAVKKRFSRFVKRKSSAESLRSSQPSEGGIPSEKAASTEGEKGDSLLLRPKAQGVVSGGAGEPCRQESKVLETCLRGALQQVEGVEKQLLSLHAIQMRGEGGTPDSSRSELSLLQKSIAEAGIAAGALLSSVRPFLNESSGRVPTLLGEEATLSEGVASEGLKALQVKKATALQRPSFY